MSLTVTLKAFSLSGFTFTGGTATLPPNAKTHVGVRVSDKVVVQTDASVNVDRSVIWLATCTTTASDVTLCIEHDPLMQIELGDVITNPVQYLDFDTDVPTPEYQEGRTYYDWEKRALTVMGASPATSQQIGRELWRRARNTTGATIPNGSAVYIVGAGSRMPRIALASAVTNTALDVIGLTTEDIPTNAEGEVAVFGDVGSLNTSGFAEGAAVYLSTTSGQLTTTPPAAPYAQIAMGVVLDSHVSQGIITVRVAGAGGTSGGGGSVTPPRAEIAAVAGTDFVAGTTTQLQLPNAVFLSVVEFSVYFDSAYQSPSTYTYDSALYRINFSSPIPLGVQKVFIVARSGRGADGTNGADGVDGTNGTNGWTPVLAVVSDGARRVHRIVAWTGGTGATPATGQYIGATGLVSTVAEAVDIRGAAGTSGTGTGDMLAANNLSDLVNKDTALSNLGGTATGVTVFKAASATAARSAIGAGTSNFDGAYGSLLNPPILGTAAAKDTGTGATNVILGNDPRLADARLPTAHSHAASDVTGLYLERELVIAVSDETTAITTGVAKITLRAPYAMTLSKIPRASLSTASSSGLVTVDVNVAGTSVLGGSKLSIDAAEKTSVTAATATTLATTAVADNAEITLDIDAAGTGAKGLKVTLYYTRAA